jgi:hypothetical protein
MIHRGIVVTHGVGNQRRVDQLDVVVEPLMTFLCQSLGYNNVHLVARTQVSDDLLASARIHLTPPGAEPEEWYVREAWWAQTFRPSASVTILSWAVGAAFFHLRSTWQYVLVRNVRRATGHAPLPQGVGVWAVVGAGPVRAVCDALVWLAITVGYLAIYAAGAVLILPFYVFLLLPFSLLWPAGVGAVQRALVNVLTGGIGDQHATTNRQVAVAGAADTVAQALWYFLAPDRPDKRAYDTVTLIAHSGGCVVTYDALARDDVQRWLRDPKHPRRMTWITVGSGLNLAWRMRARAKARDEAFWSRSLRDTVNWIDIYARYDPVPQGPAPEALVARLMGEEPRPYVSVRTSNHDWPLSDHGAYWNNLEEAMSRIVHVITDSRLGREPLDPGDGSYATRIDAGGGSGDHPLAPGVRRAIEAAGTRRQRITATWFVGIVLAAFITGALFVGSASLGDWALGGANGLLGLTWPPLTWRQAFGSFVPRGLGPLGFGGLRSPLIGAALLILLAYVLAIVALLLSHWWSWSRPEIVIPPEGPAHPGHESRRVAPRPSHPS